MASRVEQKQVLRERRHQEEARARDAERARGLRRRVYAVLGAAVVVLGGLFVISSSGGGGSPSSSSGASGGSGGSGGSGKYVYQVGDPGPGQAAPAVSLPAAQGGRFDLGAQRGKTVLLYFQEGLMCQPCWDQLKDLERQNGKVRGLGIDRMVSITTDEVSQLRQKAADEGLRTPVLADSDLGVSKTYSANKYGMMGDSRDGHSFVVVGPDGRVRWRADYGGAPNYTMYVPVDRLLSDLRKGLGARA